MSLLVRPQLDNALEALRAIFRGELIQPGDAGYGEARHVWNGMIDRRPALIARCADENDVIAAVSFARDNDLRIAVRGGGHNVAGHATVDDGIVIDLSPMKAVQVDAAAHVARVQGGATLADVDHATQEYGLVVPAGVVSETGIAGLTLGGGMGYLRGKYGLTADNLIAADVVTADGRLIHANEIDHPDLLWALRGGGGNFGIVTAFEFRLYPLGPEVAFTFVFHHGARTREGLQFFREYAATMPDEVSPLAFCGIVPATEHFPESIHGTPFIAFAAMYAGAPDEGERVLQPLRAWSEPLIDMSGRMPYVTAQKAFDEDYPRGLRYYWKSLNLSTLNDDVIDRIVDHAARQPSPYSTIDIWPIGGAVSRVAAETSAFYGRQAAFLINPEANWEDPADDAANIAWARATIDSLQPWSDGSRYLNFPGFQEEGDAMMCAAFGPNYARLVQVKNRYDPHNLFRLNQNIKPTASVDS
jgi:FAD/FMN-containing dehydrogenase